MSMYIFLVIVLLLFGIGLLVCEVFFIPGFGLAGVFGFASLIGSVVLAYTMVSALAGHLALVAAVVLTAVAIVVMLKGKTLERVALHTDIDAKVDLLADLHLQQGDKLITASRLAPMGKVRVGTKEVEAKSLGSFIDPETPVSIVGFEGNTIVVEPVAGEAK